MFLLNTSTKRAVSRKEYTMKSRYEIVLKVAEMGNITRAAKALNYTQINGLGIINQSARTHFLEKAGQKELPKKKKRQF